MYNTLGPWFLNFPPNSYNPFLPSTWRVVFSVSIGIKNILNKPAANEAHAVFNATGHVFEKSLEFRYASIPLLAAVSPNRDNGACNNAGPTPR